MHLTCNRTASRERIAFESRLAAADGSMINDAALGVEAARSDARISTFLIGARKRQRAVLVDGTFRAAVGRRAEHAWQAGAHCAVVSRVTFGVGAARRWDARCGRWFFWFSLWIRICYCG